SHFQTDFWPGVANGYKKIVEWTLQKNRAVLVVLGVIGLFIFSIVFTAIRKPPVGFFPNGDPNFVYAYIRMPIGTDQRVTDSVTRIVEERVRKVVGENNPTVQSIISNVSIGASDNPFDGGTQSTPHLGKVTVAFAEFAKRQGQSTST